MSEMVNMSPPWPGMTRKEVTCAVAAGRRPSIIPEYGDSSPNGWGELMCKCWDQDPTKRPDFEVVLNELIQIRSSFDNEAAGSEGASLVIRRTICVSDVECCRSRNVPRKHVRIWNSNGHAHYY